MGTTPRDPRYLATGEHKGSITGYFVAVPSDAEDVDDPLDDAIAATFGDRQCLLIFSTEAAASECLQHSEYTLDRIVDGDDAITRCRAAHLSIALDAHKDAATGNVQYTEVTRDPATDAPVDKKALGAALVDPEGNVIDVLMIMSATDEELREAKRHAEARGFALVVHEHVAVCSDEASLRAVIASEAHA